MSLPSLLIGFILGVMALWIYLELIAMAAKRRAPAPTLAARRMAEKAERLGPEFEKVLHENLWDLYDNGEPKREEPSVQYRFMGMTGEE